MKGIKKWENFLVYSAIITGTLVLRLVTQYPEDLVNFFKSNLILAVKIADYMGLSDVVALLQSVPPMALLLVAGILHMAAGFCVLKWKKSQMEQGVCLLIEELPQVVKSGIILYTMLAALLFISIYSVAGVWFGVCLLFIVQFAVMFGRIPLAVFLGFLLTERLFVKGHTYLFFFIGGFVMLFCESVYAIGGAFLFFVFPVLALGTLFTLFLYRCCYRVSLPVKFPTAPPKEILDRDKLRDIITKR